MSTAAHLGTVPESTLPAAELDHVAALVAEHSGIVIGPGKGRLIELRLGAVARQEKIDSVPQLLIRTRADTSGHLAGLVVDAMTTNETSFFRNPALFDLLRAELIPELLERNRASRGLRIWCGACSSGQEPYSVAMLLHEHFPQVVDTWRVRILATDISPSMVARTSAGRYGRVEVDRGLPSSHLAEHFERDGTEWQIHKHLRRMVDTRELNLAHPFPLAERFDLVLLPNVLIYFSPDTGRAVLGRVRQCLAPGGSLFLGASESTMPIDDTWVRRACGSVSCYQPAGPATDRRGLMS